MICESCKSNIPDAAKFCHKCGNKIEKEAPARAEDKQEFQTRDAAGSAPVVDAAAASSVTAASGPVGDSVTGSADKPESGNRARWIIVSILLFVAAVAGGYLFYKSFLIKEPPKAEAPKIPGLPDQSRVSPAAQSPPSTGRPAQQTAPPAYQDQYQSRPQMRTKVVIMDSALAADIRNGRPTGVAANFRYGASRVAHYVEYGRAGAGLTTFSSQYYQNGALLFKCGPRPLQYASGKYFCRPAQHLDPGNYEVRFFVDGNEEQILEFRVDY
jgi:hypothetical protein